MAGALALLAFAVLAGTLDLGFTHWDDDKYVTRNALIESLDAEHLREMFRTSSVFAGNWAPLTILSYAFDYALWGRNAFGYHLTNLLLHAACTVLLFLLLCRLLERGRPGGGTVPAALAGILFAVHPVQVESVAWISERKNVLGMALFLGSFLAWMRATASRVRFAAYGWFLLLFTASLLAKAQAVILAPLLLLHEYLDCVSKDDGRARLARRCALLLPVFGIAIWVGLVTIRAQGVEGHARETGDFLGALATAPVLIVGYIHDLFLPMNRAAILTPPIHGAPWEPVPLLTLLALGAWIAWLAADPRKRPGIVFFSGWFLLGLALVLNFVPIPVIAADRYQYWAAPGLFALAGLGIRSLWCRIPSGRRRALAVLGLSATASLIVLTLDRVPVWRDDLTLWRDAVQKSPGSYKARTNLSNALYMEGDLAGALRHAREAVALAPGEPRPRGSLGAVLLAQGKAEEAERELREAVRGDPRDSSSHANLGFALLRLGRVEEAGAALQRAIVLDPADAATRTSLSVVRLQQGNPREAEREAREAVRLDPGYALAHVNLGAALLALGRLDEADLALREALALDPGNAAARTSLSAVRYGQGKYGEAEREAREAVRLAPGYAQAQANLGAILIELGRFPDAERALREALRLDPHHAQARANLDFLRSRSEGSE